MPRDLMRRDSAVAHDVRSSHNHLTSSTRSCTLPTSMSIVPAATFVIGRFGSIDDVDVNACRLLGYSRSELLALHGTDLILPEERPAVAVSLDRMRRGIIDHRRGRLVSKDRRLIDVDIRSSYSPQGQLVLTVCAVTPDLN